MKGKLRAMRGHKKSTIVDDLLERVQSYATKLQETVDERTQELREEKAKIQSLLYELLPK